jgi:hypothetical protein
MLSSTTIMACNFHILSCPFPVSSAITISKARLEGRITERTGEANYAIAKKEIRAIYTDSVKYNAFLVHRYFV